VGGAFSPYSSRWPFAPSPTAPFGILGNGCSVMLSHVAVEDDDGLRLVKYLDIERSECEGGRGVMSDASSKVTCRKYTSQRFSGSCQ